MQTNISALDGIIYLALDDDITAPCLLRFPGSWRALVKAAVGWVTKAAARLVLASAHLAS